MSNSRFISDLKSYKELTKFAQEIFKSSHRRGGNTKASLAQALAVLLNAIPGSEVELNEKNMGDTSRLKMQLNSISTTAMSQNEKEKLNELKNKVTTFLTEVETKLAKIKQQAKTTVTLTVAATQTIQIKPAAPVATTVPSPQVQPVAAPLAASPPQESTTVVPVQTVVSDNTPQQATPVNQNSRRLQECANTTTQQRVEAFSKQSKKHPSFFSSSANNSSLASTTGGHVKEAEPKLNWAQADEYQGGRANKTTGC